MPIIEDEIIGSHTEDESQDDNDNMDEVLALFGVEPKQEEGDPVDPPIDQTKPEVKKGITVKFNKEDTFIEDEKVPELARKGLNYDKVEGRVKELQNSLDRAAKLAGYKDHDSYVADFDNIEKQQQQKEQDSYNQLKQDLREQAEDAGLDPDRVEAWLNNHPLVREAETIKQERDNERSTQKMQGEQQENIANWQSMYSNKRILEVFPNIVEDSKAFDRGELPTFFNAEMQSKIEKGYDPTDAILLAHADKFQGQSKRATEQRVIKEQQLGLRSRVETNHAPDNEKQVPAALANAFAAFGLPAESAKKYVK